MTKVIIADDHPVVRSGIRQILSNASGYDIIAEVGKESALLKSLRQCNAQILILDLGMGAAGGLALIEEAKRFCPELKILVLSMQPESMYALPAIEAGASGYLMKSAGPKEILDSLYMIQQNRVVLNENLRHQLTRSASSNESGEPFAILTKREAEILELLALGHTNREISKRLEISEKTVSAHKANLMRKLGVKNTVELIHLISSQG